MPITDVLIEKLGKKYLFIPMYYTLHDISELVVNQEGYEENNTYVVLLDGMDTYRAALFLDLEQQLADLTEDERELVYHERLIMDYDLPPVTRAVAVTTADNARQIKQWLNQNPGEIMLVLDEEQRQVVAVFCNVVMGGGDVDRSLVRSHVQSAVGRVWNYFDQRQRVQFTAFYPQQAQANQRYAIYVYAHREQLRTAIVADAQQFEDRLTDRPSAATSGSELRLVRDARLSVHLDAETIGFYPSQQTQLWNGDWVRFGFAFTMPDDGASVLVTAHIAVEGVDMASIQFTIDAVTKPTNALHRALMDDINSAQVAQTYRKIFVSYSRRDTHVVKAFRTVQMMTGDEVLMDTFSLRPGEQWRAGLARLIASADVFMLFWSRHSAASDNVRDEWDYALKHRCPETRCSTFIRPVYWEQPLVSPHVDLGHLHFRYVPLTQAHDPATASAPVLDINRAHEQLLQMPQTIQELPGLAKPLETRFAGLTTELDRLPIPVRYELGHAAYQVYEQMRQAPIKVADTAVSILDCMRTAMSMSAGQVTSHDVQDCMALLTDDTPAALRSAMVQLQQVVAKHQH
jgi:hypothetical protein